MHLCKQNGAGAFGALALLVCTHANAQTAQVPIEWDEDASAVYTAKVVDMEWVGEMACPPEYICLGGWWDLTLEPVEVLSGESDIGRQTFRVVQHASYIPGYQLVAVAQRDVTGKWHLIDRTRMVRRVCFNDPNAMVWDNVSDAGSKWDAAHNRDSGETCMSFDLP
jgi:hypothetical protein